MQAFDSVGFEHDNLRAEAQFIAEQLHFKLAKDAAQCLFITDKGYALKIPGYSLLYVDLSVAAWSKRHKEGRKQGLIRACKPSKGLKIIDATAGWGRDATLLASFGAKVLMLERNPVMAILLNNALLRRSEADKQQMRLSIQHIDALTYLKNLEEQAYPDIIYIDPMHPERSKSALVKKNLQVLQGMVGVDEDALDLLSIARLRVKQKVVVKWPQKKPALLATSSCIEGKTVRFDIYLPVCNASSS